MKEEPSQEAVSALEAARITERRMHREAGVQISQIVYTCESTGHPLWLVFPAKWPMLEALQAARQLDNATHHNHRAWETMELP